MNRYEQIFKEYVREMRRSRDAATKWWEKLQASETKRIGSAEDAAAQLEERWPFGPASHPFVLATYRKYFLQIEQLNREIEEQEEKAAHRRRRAATDDDWGAEEDDDEDDDPDSFGETENPVPAWNVLIDRLSGRHEDLSDFLASMVFAPIGVDKDENFV